MIKLGDKFIGQPNSCFVIAEAGSNHNGSLELGKKLIDAAKECGCDAVKFQAFRAENLATRKADKAQYQKGKSGGKNQFEMLKELELSVNTHRLLIAHAKSSGIPIFYSVFDEESSDMVEALGVSIFKLGSGELTNIPLIKHIAGKNKPLIISTGMATDEEIKEAVDAFRNSGSNKLLLMHCSTGYPSHLEDANLRRINYLKEKFGVPCGNSDHTDGIIVSVMAAAMGVPFIEKHFTLDKELPGPDHPMSMDPQEMRKLCAAVRVVEKNPVKEDEVAAALQKTGIHITGEEIEMILGKGDRRLPEAEIKQRSWARKSLVAARDIRAGEVLGRNDLVIRRPEEGMSPIDYEKVLGRKIRFSVEKGSPIKREMLE